MSNDRILSLSEAAEIVPLSEKQLRRVAVRGGGPFRKIENRWMVYESELHGWVRSHKPRERDATSADPMPGPVRRAERRSFRELVEKEMEKRGDLND